MNEEFIKGQENIGDQTDVVTTIEVEGGEFNLLKIVTNRNEPKVMFGEPKFSEYRYVDKKDGRQRHVVKCDIESELVLPAGYIRDLEAGTTKYLDYLGPVLRIKTTGRAVCDERDEEHFDLNLGKRVSRVRAEKAAFRRHQAALVGRVTKLVDFYLTSLANFNKKADKVQEDEIIWEPRRKKRNAGEVQ